MREHSFAEESRRLQVEIRQLNQKRSTTRERREALRKGLNAQADGHLNNAHELDPTNPLPVKALERLPLKKG
jgi:hypothetical protein